MKLARREEESATDVVTLARALAAVRQEGARLLRLHGEIKLGVFSNPTGETRRAKKLGR